MVYHWVCHIINFSCLYVSPNIWAAVLVIHILAFLVLCKLYTNTWLLLMMDIYQLNLDLLQEHKHEPSPRKFSHRFSIVRRMFINIANLRYPAKNDKFFAGERGYSQPYIKRLVRISLYPSKIDLEWIHQSSIDKSYGFWTDGFWSADSAMDSLMDYCPKIFHRFSIVKMMFIN